MITNFVLDRACAGVLIDFWGFYLVGCIWEILSGRSDLGDFIWVILYGRSYLSDFIWEILSGRLYIGSCICEVESVRL